MKKILIFNPFGIGDVLFTTPLIRNLKESLPEASITYLCNRRTYPLLESNPFLNKVLVFEKDEWRSLAKHSRLRFLKEFIRFFREVKKEKFDLVFDLSLNAQYGFFFKMAGIRMRLGFDFKNRGRFLTHKPDLPGGYRGKHIARYYLGLLNFLKISPKDCHFDLPLSDGDLKRGKGILKSCHLEKGGLLVGICPGSGDSWQDTAYFKRWPKENFLEVAGYLQRKMQAKVILFGSKPEVFLCDYLYNHLEQKPLNLCGKISLKEFVGIAGFLSLLITNDGGPFHISQALRKKAVVFFGPVDERTYGLYPQSKDCIVLKKDVPCRPCYQGFKFKGCTFDKRCLREITPGEAISAARQLLLDA